MEGWCPKCGAKRQVGPECPACGVIYAKAEAALAKDKEEHETRPLPKNEKLTQCPACNREVSKKATSCPHCGEPLDHEPPQTTPPPPQPSVGKARHGAGMGCLILIILAGLFAAVSNRTGPEKTSTPTTPKTSKKIGREAVEKCFSAWDGSHRQLVEAIKKSMNDSKSYEHDETRFSDKGDHLIVITSFRGRNKFGGMVRNFVKAKTDANNCAVLEIIDQDSL